VPGDERFWTRRLRWKLRGAWMWPTFAVLTVVEGFVLHALPPTGFREDQPEVIFAIILALFANIFFVGVISPWIARRLIARDRAQRGGERFPPEVYLDRTATVVLLIGFVGLVAAGLGNRPVVVSETQETEEAGRRARAFVDAHADPEIKRNVDAANISRLGDNDFRICVPRDDARKQYCMFIDTKRDVVKFDPSTEPNEEFGR
jgi:hypothetical protein